MAASAPRSISHQHQQAMQDKHRQIKNQMIRELIECSVDESPERFVETADVVLSKLIHYFEAREAKAAPEPSKKELALRMLDQIDAGSAEDPVEIDLGVPEVGAEEPPVTPDPVKARRNRELQARIKRGEKVRPNPVPGYNHEARAQKAMEIQEERLRSEYGDGGNATGLASADALMG